MSAVQVKFPRSLHTQGGTITNSIRGGVQQLQQHETWWNIRHFHEIPVGDGSS